MYMCPPNLHICNCRCYDQETAHGPMSTKTELWVERLIGEEKSVTAGKVTLPNFSYKTPTGSGCLPNLGPEP
jgi:hypothetical protein